MLSRIALGLLVTAAFGGIAICYAAPVEEPPIAGNELGGKFLNVVTRSEPEY